MAYTQYLVFDGEKIPKPDSYEVELTDVEADSGGQTEAGTTQRDVVRMGVVGISVSFSVTSIWLQKLTAYKNQAKINVRFFDPATADFPEREMFITGFKAKLVHDTKKKGLWEVSFSLQEF